VDGTVGTDGGGETCLQVLVSRPEYNRPLERRRHSWDYYINMELRDIVFDVAISIRLAQDRIQSRAFVDMVINRQFP